MNDFTPIGDSVFAKIDLAGSRENLRFDLSTETAGVICVGPGREVNGKYIPVSVAAGQTIIFRSGAGYRVFIDGQQYVIISERDVLGAIGRAITA